MSDVSTYVPGSMYWIEDPGHAWLVVTFADFARWIQSGGQCSSCSYIYRREAVYLEEDLDAPRFMAWLGESMGAERLAFFGSTLRTVYCDDDAPCRRRPSVSEADQVLAVAMLAGGEL